LETSLIRILVVEDFKPFRSFISLLLSENPNLDVICEAEDGQEAVEKAQQLKPDVVLMDIGLPELNGIEVARQIRRAAPSSKILFVSTYDDLDIVEGALNTGASGYVVKSDAGKELARAVEAVFQGERFVSSSLKGYEFTDTPAEKPAHHHEVQFYSDDALILDSFAHFIAVALKSGRAVIVVIAESRSDGLISRLKAQGVDVDAATQQGTYIQLDVNKTLSTFMVNDMPDSTRFFEIVGGLIEAAAKAARQQHRGVVACGECSPRLWADGKADAAIRVEQLWDEVGRTFGVDILCGYALSSFHGEEDEHVFQSICAEHSAVHSL
jgi:DNA-binding NarL/FixJ family response regulator